MKGHAKPPSFKLGQANMIPDGHTVFDYIIDLLFITYYLSLFRFLEKYNIL